MEQPKQTESPEKPVVNRRWLLFNQYKWGCCGTQREIFTCPYKCPYICCQSNLRPKVRPKVRPKMARWPLSPRSSKSLNARKMALLLDLTWVLGDCSRQPKNPKDSGLRYQQRHKTGCKPLQIKDSAFTLDLTLYISLYAV